MDKIYYISSIVLLLPGIAGAVIPILPGIPYMFLITLIYAIITKFHTLNTGEIIILTAITLLSIIIDYFSGLFGAKYGGAHKKSLLLGLLLMLIGTFVFPPFGGIIGLFLGVFIGEIITHNDQRKAIKAATSSTLGTIAGMILNLLLSIIYLILFIIFAIK